MKKILKVMGIGGVFGIFLFVFPNGLEAQTSQIPPQKSIEEALSSFQGTQDFPVLGNKDGSKELVVFLDPLCGYCHKFYAVLSQLIQEDQNLKILVLDYPVIGRERSLLIMRMSLAALKQGKYHDFMKRVYASSSFAQEDLEENARALDMDIPLLRKDMEDPQLIKHIQSTVDFGRSMRVEGTPAFIFQNNLHLGFMSLEDLRQIIQEK